MRDDPEKLWFRTIYTILDGSEHAAKFATKSENKSFADATEIMGYKSIRKEFYNSACGAWFRYHADKEIIQ